MKKYTLPHISFHIIQWIILAMLVAGLYWEIILTWSFDLWNDPNYSHGLLVPFISLYYIREKFPDIKKEIATPLWQGLLVVFMALALYILGHIGAEYFSRRLSLIILLYGLILFIEGKKIARLLLFPVGFLFFSIPLPYVLYNSVAFPLKLIATQISVFLFKLLNIPVFREGNIIHLSYTTMEVVDACSGIRSLMTLLTLAFLLAFFQHKRNWPRLLILLLATPVAVIANAIRVTMTGILISFDPAWGDGFRHEASSWLIFIISFAILGGISTLIKDKSEGDCYEK